MSHRDVGSGRASSEVVRLWGWASSLLFRYVVGRTIERVRDGRAWWDSRPRPRGSIDTGLLGRRDDWRPGDPASHHRRGRVWVDWEGCDHADGAPAAYLVAGRTDLEALPEGARYDIVRGAPRSRLVLPAQCQTRHPDGAGFSACPSKNAGRVPGSPPIAIPAVQPR